MASAERGWSVAASDGSCAGVGSVSLRGKGSFASHGAHKVVRRPISETQSEFSEVRQRDLCPSQDSVSSNTNKPENPQCAAVPPPDAPQSAARKAKRTIPSFSHKGAWVRPNTVAAEISAIHVHDRFRKIEDHAGYIDSTVAVDVAHSVLAFEFIDCINDDLLNYYLPQVDESIGKDLGLQHDANRLRMRPSTQPQRREQLSSIDGEDVWSSADRTIYEEDCRQGAASRSLDGAGSSGGSLHEHTSGFDSRPSWVSGTAEGSVDEDNAEHCSAFASPTPLTYVSEGDSQANHTPADFLLDEQTYLKSACERNEEDRALSGFEGYEDDEYCSDGQSTSLFWEQGASLAGTQSGASLPYLAGTQSSASLAAFSSLELAARPESPGDANVSDQLEDVSIGEFLSSMNLSPSDDCDGRFGTRSVEADVWPHACELLPKTSSLVRSNKLQAVDSIPSVPVKGVPEFDAAQTPSAPTPCTVGRRTLVAGIPVVLPREEVERIEKPPVLDDPATLICPKSYIYSPGASRVRAPGQHHWERFRLQENHARRAKALQKHAEVAAQARTRSVKSVVASPASPRQSKKLGARASLKAVLPMLHALERMRPGTSSVVPATSSSASSARISQRMSMFTESIGDLEAGKASTIDNAALHGIGNVASYPRNVLAGVPAHAGAREDEATWPPRMPSDDGESFEGFMTRHYQSGSTTARASCQSKERTEKNTTCPFSHESMASSVALDLRCGHRFALARLDVARRGPPICASAGLAAKGAPRDALVCPLCGDQDTTSTPVTSKMLTTYSTNTNAFIGDVRRDWRQPLRLGPLAAQ